MKLRHKQAEHASIYRPASRRPDSNRRSSAIATRVAATFPLLLRGPDRRR